MVSFMERPALVEPSHLGIAMVALLSADALAHVFDYLNVDVDDLQPCVDVCHHWRDIATAHPAYWRYISVFDFDIRQGALPYFLNRLEYGAKNKPDVPVRLSVESTTSVAKERLPDSFPHTVLEAIVKHIQRLEALHLRIDSANLQFLVSRLDNALELPCLRILDLRLRVPHDDARKSLGHRDVVFPLHSAPMLTHVALHDIFLPLTHAITQRIDVLKLHFRVMGRPPAQFLSRLFPRVQRLELVLQEPPTTPVANSFRGTSIAGVEPFITQPYGSIVMTPSIRLHDDLLSAYRISKFTPDNMPLCLGLRVGPPTTQEWHTGQIVISTQDRAIVRHFDGIMLTADDTFQALFLRQLLTPLADRLVALRLSFEDGLVQLLLEADMHLPALETLCVETCGCIADWELDHSLFCDRLRKLVLIPHSTDEVRICPSAVDHLMNRIVGLANRRISPEMIIGKGLFVQEDAPNHACTVNCGVNTLEDANDGDDPESLRCGIVLTEPDVDWLYEYL